MLLTQVTIAYVFFFGPVVRGRHFFLLCKFLLYKVIMTVSNLRIVVMLDPSI